MADATRPLTQNANLAPQPRRRPCRLQQGIHRSTILARPSAPTGGWAIRFAWYGSIPGGALSASAKSRYRWRWRSRYSACHQLG